MTFFNVFTYWFRRWSKTERFYSFTRTSQGLCVVTYFTAVPLFNEQGDIIKRKLLVCHERVDVRAARKYDVEITEEQFQRLRFEVAQ
jgi:hypothetical protein